MMFPGENFGGANDGDDDNDDNFPFSWGSL